MNNRPNWKLLGMSGAALCGIGMTSLSALNAYLGSGDQVLGAVIDTPGKAVFTEHALGIRDGLAEQGVSVSQYDQRFKDIEADRDPALSLALAPVYEDGYDRAVSGEYGESNLKAYLDAIETSKDELLDQIKTITAPRWSVASEQPLEAAAAYNLDANDRMIYDAMWSARAKAEEIGGTERGEMLFRLMMTDVAHDVLREAFSRETGTLSYGDEAIESFEGFLQATGIAPRPGSGAPRTGIEEAHAQPQPGYALEAYSLLLSGSEARHEDPDAARFSAEIAFAF